MGKRKTESRQIGDYMVVSQQLDACSALALVPKVGTILGPALSPLFTAFGAGATVASLRLDDLGALLGLLFQRMNGLDIVALALELLACTRVTGAGLTDLMLNSKEAINMAFDGDAGDLLLALKFALEVNYANFTKLLGRGALPPAASAPALSPST